MVLMEQLTAENWFPDRLKAMKRQRTRTEL